MTRREENFTALLLVFLIIISLCDCLKTSKENLKEVCKAYKNPDITTLSDFEEANMWYGLKLPPTQQAIYGKLLEHYDDIKQGKKVEITVRNSIMDDYKWATKAFYLDHPEMYWIKSANSINFETIGEKIFLLPTYSKNEFTDKDFEEIDIMISQTLNSIIQKTSNETSTSQKVKIIHDELVNSALYDYSHNQGYVISDIEKNNLAVCDGYSKYFQYMCKVVNIPCIKVEGTSVQNGEGHSWNMVLLDDGNWYSVDCTWDSPSQKEYQKTGELKITYFHFLKGNDFFLSHKPYIKWRIPESPDTDFLWLQNS